jgi:hypothetical protein
MTALATALEVVFIVAWVMCAGTFIYVTRYFSRVWIALYERRKPRKEDVSRTLKGTGVFIAGWCLAAAAGLIAQFWAGGWR